MGSLEDAVLLSATVLSSASVIIVRLENFPVVTPFLNQALTLSAALCGASPYSLYCLVAARLPSRFHLDLDMELEILAAPMSGGKIPFLLSF
jgi:hypothetical protein